MAKAINLKATMLVVLAVLAFALALGSAPTKAEGAFGFHKLKIGSAADLEYAIEGCKTPAESGLVCVHATDEKTTHQELRGKSSAPFAWYVAVNNLPENTQPTDYVKPKVRYAISHTSLYTGK